MQVNDVDPSFTRDARAAVQGVWSKYSQKLNPQLMSLIQQGQ